jgi:hypothetical protein
VGRSEAEEAVARVKKVLEGWKYFVDRGSYKDVSVSPSAMWEVQAALNGTTSREEEDAYRKANPGWPPKYP